MFFSGKSAPESHNYVINLHFHMVSVILAVAHTKASSYLTMVCPKMKYAAAVWDPYYQSDIRQLEKVQRRAARWVFNNFSTYSSVTDTLQQLSWPTLQVCHKYLDYKHY